MSTVVYHYPRCGTCKKALKWLEAQGLEAQAHTKKSQPIELRDIVEAPPSASRLRKLIRRSGLPLSRFFNTSGQSYRQGGFKDKLPGMKLEEAVAALAADGKLIKRPLVEAEGFVLVGFKQAEWEEAFGK